MDGKHGQAVSTVQTSHSSLASTISVTPNMMQDPSEIMLPFFGAPSESAMDTSQRGISG